MRIGLVKIGNSKGVRLPSAIIEQCGFKDHIELEVRGSEVVLRAARRPAREGWDEAIAAAIEKNGPPEMLWPDEMTNEFDEKEWKW